MNKKNSKRIAGIYLSRYIKELLIMAIVVTAIGLAVSYATVNVTLDIAGFSSARVPSWNVKFVSAEVVDKIGSAEVVYEPKIRGLNIHYEVKLEEPGDSVTIKSVIENAGTLDAKLESYDIIGVPSKYEGNISYKITDVNGNDLKEGTILKGGKASENEKYMTVYITITYEAYIYEGEGYRTFDLGLGLNFVQNYK